MSEDDVRFVVRCRGLPWTASKEEILDFFANCNSKEGTESVHLMTTRDGKPSGEAYVELLSEEDVQEALKKHRQHLGKRYVEVFRAKYSEMQWVLQRCSGDAGGRPSDDPEQTVVKLRGLPYECSHDDIKKFFQGLTIVPNGILLTTNYQGRSTGEAFVQFASKAEAEGALDRNRENIGHRYVEVFCSSMSEAMRHSPSFGPMGMNSGAMKPSGRGYGRDMYGGGSMRRPGPYDRAGAPPMGRGYGPMGPTGRGPRNFKGYENNYGNDMGYGNNMGYGNDMGYGRQRMPTHIVKMRGLPFQASENEIAEWFSSVADPMDIIIRYNSGGKPTGEAEVAFASEADARRAMSKDRQNMQHRYVELFYTPPNMGGGRSGGYRY